MTKCMVNGEQALLIYNILYRNPNQGPHPVDVQWPEYDPSGDKEYLIESVTPWLEKETPELIDEMNWYLHEFWPLMRPAWVNTTGQQLSGAGTQTTGQQLSGAGTQTTGQQLSGAGTQTTGQQLSGDGAYTETSGYREPIDEDSKL